MQLSKFLVGVVFVVRETARNFDCEQGDRRCRRRLGGRGRLGQQGRRRQQGRRGRGRGRGQGLGEVRSKAEEAKIDAAPFTSGAIFVLYSI